MTIRWNMNHQDANATLVPIRRFKMCGGADMSATKIDMSDKINGDASVFALSGFGNI